jgi:multidrug efflux pump subunit AcrB
MEWQGEYEASSESQKYLFMYLPLAIVLMIAVLIALFNDYKKPLIIIFSLPLAAIGIVLGMLVSGKEFGFVAIVGALGLMGMMIKNGVVLLEEVELQVKEGKHRFAALMDASTSRLRPVMMASLTTILGMIPLITDAMFGSMAVTMMSGLLIGTIITLLMIPVLYALFYNVIHPLSKKAKKQENA